MKSIEISLANFQRDLGDVSTQIETLQSLSTTLSRKLDGRQVVEKSLGPAIEDVALPPSAVDKLLKGPIDQEWGAALAMLEKRQQIVNEDVSGSTDLLTVSDLRPLFNELANAVSLISQLSRS